MLIIYLFKVPLTTQVYKWLAEVNVPDESLGLDAKFTLVSKGISKQLCTTL